LCLDGLQAKKGLPGNVIPPNRVDIGMTLRYRRFEFEIR